MFKIYQLINLKNKLGLLALFIFSIFASILEYLVLSATVPFVGLFVESEIEINSISS